MVVTFKVVHVVRLDNQKVVKKDAVTGTTLTTLKLSIQDIESRDFLGVTKLPGGLKT